jgi:predicted O-methyltransferase YrrM
MTREEASIYVRELYIHILRREPGEEEFAQWVEWTEGRDFGATELLKRFVESKEYHEGRRVQCTFPPGHYHSPIVDPAIVSDYYQMSSTQTFEGLHGVAVLPQEMRRFWLTNLKFIQTTPFTEERVARNRFHYEGSPFPYGDAITLRAMIQYYQPRRFIEIGSGFSTACLLDSADDVGLPELKITCIEPNTTRLRELLRPDDYKRIRLLETDVQSVPLDTFRDLQAGDILFVDSTHVLKTGSDVHYELFHILPTLQPGVIVHFHDCQYPFEYPAVWIFDANYCWNEVYALRAFLMYNYKFEVLFWGGALAAVYNKELQTECPTFLRNPGGSIWLRVKC